MFVVRVLAFRVLSVGLLGVVALVKDVSAQSFDFALDSLVVDGNVAGSGSPNGAADFSDTFDDGSLTVFPTSALTCQDDSVKSESDGFLRLTSSDGASRRSPGFLVDSCVLGLATGGEQWRLTDGSRDSVITASFRADTPTHFQVYGLQIFSLGTNELVTILVNGGDGGTSVVALVRSHTGQERVTSVPINLAGIRRIFLRLTFSDADNSVGQSFSVDGGLTFTNISVSPRGSVLTGASQAVTSVFGGVSTEARPPESCSPPGSAVVDALNAVPLANAETREPRFVNDRGTATFRVGNYTGLYLGVPQVHTSTSANSAVPHQEGGIEGVFAELRFVPPCADSDVTNVGIPTRCQSPGVASWTVSFCTAGTTTFRLGLTDEAFLVNVVDLFASSTLRGSPLQLLTISRALNSRVEGFRTAANCLSARAVDGVQAVVTCVNDAIVSIARMPEQIHETQRIAAEHGIGVSTDQIAGAASGFPLSAMRLATSLGHYGFHLGQFSEDPTAILIRLRAR